MPPLPPPQQQLQQLQLIHTANASADALTVVNAASASGHHRPPRARPAAPATVQLNGRWRRWRAARTRRAAAARPQRNPRRSPRRAPPPTATRRQRRHARSAIGPSIHPSAHPSILARQNPTAIYPLLYMGGMARGQLRKLIAPTSLLTPTSSPSPGDSTIDRKFFQIWKNESLAFTIVSLVSNSLIFLLFQSLYTFSLILISTSVPVLCQRTLKVLQ